MRAFGHRVIPDAIGGFAGPLAGLHRGLTEAQHDLVATVACDSPFLPHDLSRACTRRSSAKAPTSPSRAPAISRTRSSACAARACCRSLTAFLEGGGRKIDAWYAALKVVEVPFDDEPDAFSNINTEAELHDFEQAGRAGRTTDPRDRSPKRRLAVEDRA